MVSFEWCDKVDQQLRELEGKARQRKVFRDFFWKAAPPLVFTVGSGGMLWAAHDLPSYLIAGTFWFGSALWYVANLRFD